MIRPSTTGTMPLIAQILLMLQNGVQLCKQDSEICQTFYFFTYSIISNENIVKINSCKELAHSRSKKYILCPRQLQPAHNYCAVRVQWFSSVHTLCQIYKKNSANFLAKKLDSLYLSTKCTIIIKVSAYAL